MHLLIAFDIETGCSVFVVYSPLSVYSPHCHSFCGIIRYAMVIKCTICIV